MDSFRGGIERRRQQCLRRLNQVVQLIALVRDAGNALIRFDADEERAAVGVRQSGKQARDVARQVFVAPLAGIVAAKFKGAQELQELSAFLFEQMSDLFAVHVLNQLGVRDKELGVRS